MHMSPENPPDNRDLQAQTEGHTGGAELDAASKSLSDALRISFAILKIIMIVLVVLFLASGFETVGPDEQAVVLRFGRIRGIGENRVLKPRAMPYWVFPYPIEQMIKVPVGKVVDLDIRSFWYHLTEAERLAASQGKDIGRGGPTLDPIKDGYCLVRSEQQSAAVPGSDGSDYSIVHSKWQLVFRIGDPELFVKNVYVEDPKPGEIYFNVMTRSITPLLKNILEDAVVDALVNYTIDEVIQSRETIPKHVERLVRQKLAGIKSAEIENICGIKVESVFLTDVKWPRQVDEAFQAAVRASQERQKAISEARTKAQNILNETAGPVAEQLYTALHDPTVDQQQLESLWARLSGKAQEKIFEARAYRTRVVADAKASADYLRSLLPEYRKHPRIVIQGIYRDAMEQILGAVDEKFVVEPVENGEIRVVLNRNPALKKRPGKEQKTEKQE